MSPFIKLPLQISGYQVLPVTLPPLPSSFQQATHYLYIAPHQPKIPTPTASRSLFAVNIPFDSTEIHLKHLFSTQISLPAGRIEHVQFESQRKKDAGAGEFFTSLARLKKKGKKRKRESEGGVSNRVNGMALPVTWDRDLQMNGLTAVILFVDRASMDAALKAMKIRRKDPLLPVWGEFVEAKVPCLGYSRYLNHHRLTYPDTTALLQSVNSYMTAFAATEVSQARLLARQRQEADADGFITVTRGGRTYPARQEAAQEQAAKQNEKQSGLEDFYRFQSREKRKKRAGELARKFAKDKERLRKMRDNRGRFKPE